MLTLLETSVGVRDARHGTSNPERHLTMRCAFCESSMTVRPTVDGVEGETGGMWWQETFECSSCGGVIKHDVMEKIGSLRESWRIETLPNHAAAATELHCPACDALLVSAWVPEARPAPATTFDATRPASAARVTDHLCMGCNARYVLEERVEVTWRKADEMSAGHTVLSAIASPLPYSRSR